MCIRDSHYPAKSAKQVLTGILVVVMASANCNAWSRLFGLRGHSPRKRRGALASTRAVSYTHLDVYKRHLQWCYVLPKTCKSAVKCEPVCYHDTKSKNCLHRVLVVLVIYFFLDFFMQLIKDFKVIIFIDSMVRICNRL